MDRNAITGLVLIAAILIGFQLFNSPDVEESESDDTAEEQNDSIPEITEVPDSVTDVDSLPQITEIDTALLTELPDTLRNDPAVLDSIRMVQDSIRLAQLKANEAAQLEEQFGVFTPLMEGMEEIVILENDKVHIELTNKGGMIRKVELPEFRSYDDYKAERSTEDAPLVLADSTHENYFSFILNRKTPVQLNSNDLYFTVQKKTDEEVVFRMSPGGDSYMDITYSLAETNYQVDYSVTFHNMEKYLKAAEIAQYNWNMKSRSLEKSMAEEQKNSGVFYQYKGESRDYLSEAEDDELDLEARLDWLAFKQAYFSMVLINSEGAILKGGEVSHQLIEEDGYVKGYYAELDQLNIESTDNGQFAFSLYLGPNRYKELAAYDNGMLRIINYGPSLFGWINRNFFQPIFSWMADFGLNFGIVILLLTIFVRVLITPLVFRNYKSSAKMRVMKPEVDEINKKYPDRADAMKKQQEVMALYRSTGVNPMAGCVPMLIQMPILFAMFRFIPSSFEIRQASFLWADDLSSYDSILNLGFEIPFYGDHVSLFTLLMAASTLAYTLMNSNQMSNPAGVQGMKLMMYLFPIMMIFFFNGYASGLSYYYLLSNLMSMGIMTIIKTRFIDEEKIRATLQENKKKPKKKSKFAARLEQMQKAQQQKMQDQQNNRQSRRQGSGGKGKKKR